MGLPARGSFRSGLGSPMLAGIQRTETMQSGLAQSGSAPSRRVSLCGTRPCCALTGLPIVDPPEGLGYFADPQMLFIAPCERVSRDGQRRRRVVIVNAKRFVLCERGGAVRRFVATERIGSIDVAPMTPGDAALDVNVRMPQDPPDVTLRIAPSPDMAGGSDPHDFVRVLRDVVRCAARRAGVATNASASPESGSPRPEPLTPVPQGAAGPAAQPAPELSPPMPLLEVEAPPTPPAAPPAAAGPAAPEKREPPPQPAAPAPEAAGGGDAGGRQGAPARDSAQLSPRQRFRAAAQTVAAAQRFADGEARSRERWDAMQGLRERGTQTDPAPEQLDGPALAAAAAEAAEQRAAAAAERRRADELEARVEELERVRRSGAAAVRALQGEAEALRQRAEEQQRRADAAAGQLERRDAAFAALAAAARRKDAVIAALEQEVEAARCRESDHTDPLQERRAAAQPPAAAVVLGRASPAPCREHAADGGGPDWVLGL
eukprot:TRINITY_DN29660_c0_g1_i2.p2 TRINITY_DN29660_c0_g1~~TRINITY_DN29660_c0_g1_i2.p2  ORF type:complete len:513 (+),score=159.75 TRINITY_DN29660_c0_g1_i2:72-1541(+)